MYSSPPAVICISLCMFILKLKHLINMQVDRSEVNAVKKLLKVK